MDKADLERYKGWHDMVLAGKLIGLSPSETMIFTGAVFLMGKEGRTFEEATEAMDGIKELAYKFNKAKPMDVQ